MFWRFFSFLACQFAGGLGGWYAVSLTPWPSRELAGLLTGVIAGGVLWFLMDTSRAAVLLRWLRTGDTSDAPMRSGLWGDLSDRVRRKLRSSEKATTETEQRLSDFLSAFQASPSGVVLLDPRGQIEWFNQMAAAHFGLDADRDLLQHMGNLVRDPGFVSYFAGRDFRADLVMTGRQSTPARPVRLSVHLHPYGQGRLLLLSRDITAVEQAEAMRRDFVANVSHEIRTPLTVLAGFVETMQTLSLSHSDHQKHLALMGQQTHRMQTLLDDLLTLSRLEGSPPPRASDWASMPTLMRQLEQEGQALSAVLYSAENCMHTLEFCSIVDMDISGSRIELLSAMSNLVGNAIRYTPPGGEIQVRMALLADNRAEFSVRDTGPGIAPEHIPRITERFYRVDGSRSRDTGGTGLGLSIVKHVAQRHGAELRIESIMGKGSLFALVFPASRMRHQNPKPACAVPLSGLGDQ